MPHPRGAISIAATDLKLQQRNMKEKEVFHIARSTFSLGSYLRNSTENKHRIPVTSQMLWFTPRHRTTKARKMRQAGHVAHS